MIDPSIEQLIQQGDSGCVAGAVSGSTVLSDHLQVAISPYMKFSLDKDS